MSDGERVELAKALVEHLEDGDKEAAQSAMAELVGVRDSVIFNEVGRVVRELHDEVRSFALDSRLSDIAQQEIPDATERLRYVIGMTEQAANTSLAAVETAMPKVDSLTQNAAELGQDWAKFRRKEMSIDEFRELAKRIDVHLEELQATGTELHDQLGEVMMAQSFQDVTGQVIKRVIELVQDVEGRLVELLKVSGANRVASSKQPQNNDEPDIEAQGPAVPGLDHGVAKNQDEVDDLLSSLGF